MVAKARKSPPKPSVSESFSPRPFKHENINNWHHRLHQVTGEMAKLWATAKPEDLNRWSAELKLVASSMVEYEKPKR